MNSIRDELEFILSGRTIPYDKVAVVLMLVITLILGAMISNNTILEGKIAVIDMDNSKYSRDLIAKMNASEFIKVTEVIYSPVSADKLLYHGKNLGVIYLPQGLEEARWKGNNSIHIGTLYDRTNSAQCAELTMAVNEIIQGENGEIGGPRIGKMGLSSEQNEAIVAGIGISDRQLFNPTGSMADGIVVGLLYFLSTIIYTLVVLQIIAHLKIRNKWEEEILSGNPFRLLGRLIPYATMLISVLIFGMAILRWVQDFRFAGNILAYMFSLIIFAMSMGMIGLIFGWSANDPSAGSSKMILLVPPGFIFGGMTLARAYLSDWVAIASKLWPLTWQFDFLRDFAIRGALLRDMYIPYCEYILYMLVIAVIFFAKYFKEYNRLIENKKCENPIL